MPTENRSSNTEMVSVPRKPTPAMLEAMRAPCGETDDGYPNPATLEERYMAAINAAPAEQNQSEPVAWSAVKPVSPGAYWIRGNGLDQDALVQVINDDGELRCNLHQRTTEADFGWGYAVSDLSPEFEWLGPLYPHSDPGEVERLRVEVEKQRHLKMLVAEKLQNALANCSVYRHQLAERDALLREKSGDLIRMAAHLISAPLFALQDLQDEDKKMTRARVDHAVDVADARLKDAAYELRRIADALYASPEPQVKS